MMNEATEALTSDCAFLSETCLVHIRVGFLDRHSCSIFSVISEVCSSFLTFMAKILEVSFKSAKLQPESQHRKQRSQR